MIADIYQTAGYCYLYNCFCCFQAFLELFKWLLASILPSLSWVWARPESVHLSRDDLLWFMNFPPAYHSTICTDRDVKGICYVSKAFFTQLLFNNVPQDVRKLFYLWMIKQLITAVIPIPFTRFGCTLRILKLKHFYIGLLLSTPIDCEKVIKINSCQFVSLFTYLCLGIHTFVHVHWKYIKEQPELELYLD